MTERQHRKIRVDNEKHVHHHAGEWWKACARVDVEALRRDVKADEFSSRRIKRLCYFGRPMEGWERQVLKELVAQKQRERYERWKPMEEAWRRRGVEF